MFYPVNSNVLPCQFFSVLPEKKLLSTEEQKGQRVSILCPLGAFAALGRSASE